jgi:hypothetical protein
VTRPDPTNTLGCDPAKEACISISEKEFLHYLDVLGDVANLRQQLKSCQERHGKLPTQRFIPVSHGDQ